MVVTDPAIARAIMYSITICRSAEAIYHSLKHEIIVNSGQITRLNEFAILIGGKTSLRIARLDRVRGVRASASAKAEHKTK